MASMIDFFSGCVGGAAGVIIGHPFDTVKVVMQTSEQRLSVMSVVRNHSMKSLYQGIKAPLSGLAAINAVLFGVYGSIMRQCPNENRRQTMLWNSMAGSAAGMVQCVITTPMELVKTRAQLSSVTVTQSMRHVMRNEGGIRGLYRGFWLTVARDVPAFATYFASYEWMIARMAGSDYPVGKGKVRPVPSTAQMLLAGGTAGALSWLVCYPMDVLKSRMQADLRYGSLAHCLRDTVGRDGLAALTRGCGPTLVRAFPTNAATFAVVTWTLFIYETYFSRGSELLR